jgi:geranylgeranyl diphosphate synthase, type II
MSSFDLNAYQDVWRKRLEETLGALLDEAGHENGCPKQLADAMRYSVLGEGKRLRPFICLGALRSVGGEEEKGLHAACALEFVHAYSLVHDDLPAMDDDDYRRGRLTCHRAFGEAMGILTGDALLTQAFRILVQGVPANRAAEAVELLARAAGSSGMVGGQVDDVQEMDHVPSRDEVERIHERKTGRLIEAAARLGGLVGDADELRMEALGRYGQRLGLAFQIADDLLAFAGDEKALGRPTRSDQDRKRRTHPLAVGVEASRRRATALVEEALSALQPLGSMADVLSAIGGLVRIRIS